MEIKQPLMTYETQKINEIFIRRKNKIILRSSSLNLENLPLNYLTSFMKNIESFGYTINEAVQSMLIGYNIEEITEINNYVTRILAKQTGGNVLHKPMYPNFPEQVMEASEAELYVNAILHYFGDAIGQRIIPRYKKEFRTPMLESLVLKVIGLGTIDEFHEMFLGLMKSKTSISPQDREDLTDYFNIVETIDFRFPNEFNHKEVMTFVLKIVNKKQIDIPLSNYLKTATDVLRFATALSEGDVSLASNTKFISFDRRTRRQLLMALENSKTNILEDMVGYSNKWIALGERLHPGDYSSAFPKTYQNFIAIRNDVDIHTFASKVEKALKLKQTYELVNLLKTRPGIFARRLDHAFRTASGSEDYGFITKSFAKVAHEVATPVLLQVQNHFKYRDLRGSDYRVFFPKGSVAKMQVIKNDLELLPFGVCNSIDLICQQTLWNRFEKLDKLGKVYVDPLLKGYNVAFSQRSASNAQRTLVRGSRIPLDRSKNTVRLFMWWTDNQSRVDLDLSAIMYDDDFNDIGHISYTNLRMNKEAFHSGDLTSAPSGASEFIDINIKELMKNHSGARYVAMNVYSFTHQNFNDVDCFAGWMERSDVQSGEIFEPKTVSQRFDMTAESKTMFPLIIDLLKREVIWCDIAVRSGLTKGGRNVESNLNIMTILLEGIAKWKKPNLYDLFKIHGDARGTLVDYPQEADFVFSTEKFRPLLSIKETLDGPEGIIEHIPTDITPLDIEKIISEYI